MITRKIIACLPLLFFLSFSTSLANNYYAFPPPPPPPVIIEQPVYNFTPSSGPSYYSAPSRSTSAEDEFDGFNEIPWGTPIEEIKDQLTFVETTEEDFEAFSIPVDVYIRNTETLKEMDPNIEQVTYLFHNGIFFRAKIEVSSYIAYSVTAIYLGDAYGHSDMSYPSRGSYRSNDEYSFAKGSYLPLGKTGSFSITSDEQYQEIRKPFKKAIKEWEKAKKKERKEKEEEKKRLKKEKEQNKNQ